VVIVHIHWVQQSAKHFFKERNGNAVRSLLTEPDTGTGTVATRLVTNTGSSAAALEKSLDLIDDGLSVCPHGHQ
jgi:hypothetical protein